LSTSFCQDNRESIQKLMLDKVIGHNNLFKANFQLRTFNIETGLLVCRRIKERFARVVHKRRTAGIPFFGSLEVKGHLHCHILTTTPDGMDVLELSDRMKSVTVKTKGLYPDYHKFKHIDDPKGWIKYITKFEDQNDQLVWF
jgi:hypothetical protein